MKVLLPQSPGSPSPLEPTSRDWDILLTAETHNFPCAVAPYPGTESDDSRLQTVCDCEMLIYVAVKCLVLNLTTDPVAGSLLAG